jgi:hypothetical protein
VRIERRHQQLKDGTLHVGDPKTDAGIRTVALPAQLVVDLERHLDETVGFEPDALLFRGMKGGRPSPERLAEVLAKARTEAKLEQVHFHDLRHTGNTLAAATGASTREHVPDGPQLAGGRPQVSARHPGPGPSRACARWTRDARLDGLKIRPATGGLTCGLFESGRRESNSRSQLGKLMFCR